MSKDSNLNRLELWRENDATWYDNKRLTADQDFTGPVADRKCTDVLYLIIFVVFNLGLIGVAYWVINEGDVNRLGNGYDFRAEIWGVDGLEDREYMYYPDVTNLNFPLCIEECPQHIERNTVCIYDTDHKTLLLDWPCWDTYRAKAIGKYCIPETEDGREDVVDELVKTGQIFKSAAGDLRDTWELMLIGVLISIGLGVSFLYLTRKKHVLNVFVITNMVVSVICIATLAWLLAEESKRVDDQFWGDDGTVQPENCETGIESKAYLYLCYGLAGLGGIYLIYMTYYRHRVKVAIELLSLATKPMKKLNSVFLFPIAQAILGLGVIILLVTVLLYTMSTGEIVKFDDQNIPGGEAKKIEFSEIEDYLMVYVGVLIFWWMAVIEAWGDFIICGAVATWYFTREKSTLDQPFTKSLKNFGRYHLGSMILGTIARITFKVPRWWCRRIRRSLDRVEDSNSSKVNWITTWCCCWLESYEKFVRYITRYQYMYMAIFGDRFRISGKRAFFLIERNLPRVLYPAEAAQFIIFVMKISITVVGTTFTYAFLLNQDSTLRGEDIDEIMGTFGPAALTFIICAFIAQVFGGAIQSHLDGVILCVAMDDEMFVREQRFMIPKLAVFFDKLAEEQTEHQKEHKAVKQSKKAGVPTRKVAPEEDDNLGTIRGYENVNTTSYNAGTAEGSSSRGVEGDASERRDLVSSIQLPNVYQTRNYNPRSNLNETTINASRTQNFQDRGPASMNQSSLSQFPTVPNRGNVLSQLNQSSMTQNVPAQQTNFFASRMENDIDQTMQLGVHAPRSTNVSRNPFSSANLGADREMSNVSIIRDGNGNTDRIVSSRPGYYN